MKFLTILSLLSVGAYAAAVAQPEAVAEPEADAYDAADNLLEKRADCSRILPICAAAVRIQGATCPCRSQRPSCSLYACRGGSRVSATSSLFLLKGRCCLRIASTLISQIHQLTIDTDDLRIVRLRLRVRLSDSSDPTVR